MSAREQTREVVLALYPDDDDYIGIAYEQADAASDVWEPLLREAYEAYRDNLVGPINDETRDKLRRMKEAIGV